MGCGTVTVKSCLGLISIFFWACAVTLVVIGSLILAEYGKIEELAKSTDIVIPSVIVIGAGVVLFVIGLLGCIGGLKGNKAALSVFFMMTLIVLVGEVAAVALGYHYQKDLGSKLTDKMHTMIKKCENSTNEVDCDELAFIQQKMECCGSDNYTDWYKWGLFNQTVTQSCCKHKICDFPNRLVPENEAKKVIYTEGCSNKIVNSIKEQFTWVFVGTIVVAILQTLAMVATCILLCRSQESPYTSLDSQGYRI